MPLTRWAKYLNHPSGPSPGHTCTITPHKVQARLPLLRELLIASKGTCYLFSLPPSAAEAPAKSCLKFWSGLLSISMDWRNPRTLVSIRMAVMSTQVQRATSSHRLSHPFLLTHPCSPYSAPSSHLLLLPKVFFPSGSVPHPLAHLCPSRCDPLLSTLTLLFGEGETENPAKPGVGTHHGIQETRGQRAAISKRIPKGKTD